MNMHNFHIPVLGLAFSIDTPIKVAHLGIDSVVSIVDDELLEQVRKVYSEKHNRTFLPIHSNTSDARAKRITAYLDLVKELVDNQIQRFKKACTLDEAKYCFELLPANSEIRQMFRRLLSAGDDEQTLAFARNQVRAGSIDVNIMTKVDRINYRGGRALDKEYNDAHAALRGFAKSKLQSSLVLSAGLNPSLYSYIASFEDFFPDQSGSFAKRLVLKVSDYRSALIQGKFLAKKGLWVSEFRIESGLNCGGHAFATEGHLMGPILQEFKEKRSELQQTLYSAFESALVASDRMVPEYRPKLKVTAQGGVGTADEHNFLINNYELDSVGWGSPFLLVPEATCVDGGTREQVRRAEEKDLYLSKISPLGVPFNNLKNSTKDIEKENAIGNHKPGSPCVKKYLAFSKEFTDKPLCTASRKYQDLKIKDLKAQKLNEESYRKAYQKLTEKACICTGLATPFLLENKLDTKKSGSGVSICPGPNMAYFSKIVSLKNMIDHIYGRIDIIVRDDRPHMFIKELGLYMDHIKKQIESAAVDASQMTYKKIQEFMKNLEAGITYYQNLDVPLNFKMKQKFDESLTQAKTKLLVWLGETEPAL